VPKMESEMVLGGDLNGGGGLCYNARLTDDEVKALRVQLDLDFREAPVLQLSFQEGLTHLSSMEASLC
jgi:hypothetical protein